MHPSLKTIVLFSLIFLISACNASSSDAKKVEVKKASATETSTETHVEKPASAKQASEANQLAVGEAANFVEGKHYVKIEPEMNTDVAPGKVEVIELMWLGCPHCYELEPTMLKYKKNHPDYVEFKQVPAMLNPRWAQDAKTYYIAEILDPTGEKNLITQIFQGIHEQRRRLNKPEVAKRFFLSQGYTEEQYNNAKDSMAMQVKLKRAQEISVGSQANSVPALIINGKYRTSAYMAGGEEKLMEVVDMLTTREHK